MNYYSAFLFLCLGLFSLHRIQAFELPSDDEEEEKEEVQFEACHLPTGIPAYCVPLSNCKQMTSLISHLTSPLPGDIRLLLVDSFFCGRNDAGQTTVCCPMEGIDPPVTQKPPVAKKDGCSLQIDEPASCALYSRCSPFLQLLTNLRRPFPPEIPKLMQKGWLCGLDVNNGVRLPKVCCPDAAIDPIKKDFSSHENRPLLESKETCGKAQIDGRIVGGEDAFRGEYPWLANLGFTSSTNPTVSFKCGGSLISDRYVLTAAHCVTGLPSGFNLVTVRLGEHDLRQDPDVVAKAPDHFIQDFEIEKVIAHEEYNTPNTFSNDIALLRLNKKVERRSYVYPICLPFDDKEDEAYKEVFPDDLSERKHTEVAGWGATNQFGRDPADILQKLKINVTDFEECSETYGKRGAKLTNLKQMCAGGEEGLDSCVGDSGSALMKEFVHGNGDTIPRYKLIGVVSFGPRRCGTANISGVYTRVRAYLDWILDNIEP